VSGREESEKREGGHDTAKDHGIRYTGATFGDPQTGHVNG
jgi:hypothetical protein